MTFCYDFHVREVPMLKHTSRNLFRNSICCPLKRFRIPVYPDEQSFAPHRIENRLCMPAAAQRPVHIHTTRTNLQQLQHLL